MLRSPISIAGWRIDLTKGGFRARRLSYGIGTKSGKCLPRIEDVFDARDWDGETRLFPLCQRR